MGQRDRRTRKSERGRRDHAPEEFGFKSLEEVAAMEAAAGPPAAAPRPDGPKGRLLAFDYGTVRIGLAISDHDRRMASPLENYTRVSVETDGDYFRQLAKREQAVGLVVGLPVHMDGSENRESEGARAYAKWLTELTGLPVVMWDERLSSFAADELMAGVDMPFWQKKAKRDKLAAMVFLQTYLDAGCPTSET
jgi:putative holliday junction resolvase